MSCTLEVIQLGDKVKIKTPYCAFVIEEYEKIASSVLKIYYHIAAVAG